MRRIIPLAAGVVLAMAAVAAVAIERTVDVAASIDGFDIAPASVTSDGCIKTGATGTTFNANCTSGKIGIGKATPSADIDILSKSLTLDYLDNTAAADGTYYALFRATAGASSPAAAAEVATLGSQYIWRKGDNQNFVASAIEGVVRSQGADESMTARGVYGRFYIDPAYSATLRTGIGGEFSARASYAGGTEIAAESGTAFVGLRVYMAPYFSDATIGNVNNFHGIWIHNEATNKTVTNGLRLSGAGGTAFTNDLNLQNGETITNATDGLIKQAGDSEVTGQSITKGSSTVSGAGGLGVTYGVSAATGVFSGSVSGGPATFSSMTSLGDLSIGAGSANQSIILKGSNYWWITANPVASTLGIGGNGGTLPGSFPINIKDAGNVGIGTSAPQATLDVNGNAQFGSGASKSTFTATGHLIMSAALAHTPAVYSLADDGAGTSPALTLDVSSGTAHIACADTNGCTVTMAETNATTGQSLVIANTGAQTVTFADQANVLKIPGATVALAADQVLTLYYTGAIWLGQALSAND